LYTIKTFTYPSDAAVMRSFLDSNGIQTFLNNEINAQVDPLLSYALGGVQLMVPNEQAEMAVNLLRENGFELGNKMKENKLLTWINKVMSRKVK
jgi:hypothetical protein